MPRNAPTSRQLAGSEFGGVERTVATVQPKPADTLTNAELLRLGYLTGRENEPESMEDRRQMLGLLPAKGVRPPGQQSGGQHPNWLGGTGSESEASRQHLGEDPLEVIP
jgi:hypothetical protein